MSTKRIQFDNDTDKGNGNHTFKDLFEDLKEEARASGISVELKPKSVLKDYAAMNSEAAKVMGFPMPENTIYIDENASDKAKYHDLRHEYTEMGKMRSGDTYWQAHTSSLRSETKKVLPTPITENGVEADLKQSIHEEQQAVKEYRERAERAEESWDKDTAKLYRHIAPEEEQHLTELRHRNRIRTRNVRISPPWKRLR